MLCREPVGGEDRIKLKLSGPQTSAFTVKENKHGLSRNILLRDFMFKWTASIVQTTSFSWFRPRALSSISPTGAGQTDAEDEPFSVMSQNHELEFNRVNCLVWVLHESARSFSHATQTLELARNEPELSMAWVGVDVHAWHKRISYQACKRLLKYLV